MTFITEDMTVGEVVTKYPEVVDTLAGFGVHCVGCQAAPWEPLGQGLRGHGMNDDQVKESVETLNSTIEAAKNTKAVSVEAITITENAVKKAKEFREAEGKPTAHLRFAVIPGGCSGMSYDLHFDETIKIDDTVIEKDGLKILISPQTAKTASGAVIDYVDGLQGSGFKIENPEAKSGCGCGKSFN